MKDSTSTYNFQEGDVLLFTAPNIESSYSIIEMGQAISPATIVGRHKGGHKNTTHAAICVGRDEHNNVLIAHFGVDGAYSIARLVDKLGDSKRSIHLFRSDDIDARKRIAQEAQNSVYSRASYNTLGTVKAILTPNSFSASDTDKKSFFCSEFVIHVLSKVGIKLNIGEASSPRVLESALRKSKYFRKSLILHKDSMQDFNNLVLNEIRRLKSSSQKSAQDKGDALEQAYLHAQQEIGSMNNTQKLLHITHRIMPILSHKRNNKFLTPTSCKNVRRFMERRGFSSKDLMLTTQVSLIPTISGGTKLTTRPRAVSTSAIARPVLGLLAAEDRGSLARLSSVARLQINPASPTKASNRLSRVDVMSRVQSNERLSR
jgi:hypothetical protein